MFEFKKWDILQLWNKFINTINRKENTYETNFLLGFFNSYEHLVTYRTLFAIYRGVKTVKTVSTMEFWSSTRITNYQIPNFA